MKTEILRALSKSDSYVSGQELCETFGVSRTAVWKVINQLKQEGYEIASVPRKGYRITHRPDCLTEEEIASRMDTVWAGRTVCALDTVDSTNNEAKRLAEHGAAEGMLVVTEEQCQGKGRRGRSWVMPRGSAIAMSLILRPTIAPDRASMVTLVMGLAVARACQRFCGVKTSIKWPNDVVADGRKICGILTEMSSEVDYINYLVIGTGINTHVEQFPPELAKTATSLHMLTGKVPDRAGLVAACMKEFEDCYACFLATQDLSLLMEEYNALLAGKGGVVRVLEPGHEYTGISEGINNLGELLVRRENGTVEAVYAGEVSVRGVYGYV